jgi:uncharacterized membrane protein YgcG
MTLTANLLSVNYEDDWMYLDGIEDLGLEFGSSRVTRYIAPTNGIKAKRASPTHNEVIVAASTIGYETTDLVFVVFAATMLFNSVVVEPLPEDKLIAFDTNWTIKSVKQNVDFSQWRCYCRRTTKTSIEVIDADFDYFKPGGVFGYFRTDGTSTYLQP